MRSGGSVHGGTVGAVADPTHWLLRLSSEEWLSAAEGELVLAAAALAARKQREGLTYARRAAGMAWNAVLRREPDESYGRSYMDHLRALSRDDRRPTDVRAAARALLEAPMALELVPLGPGSPALAEAASIVVGRARAEVNAP